MQVLKRDGKEPPEWEKWARKDMLRVGRMPDSGESVDVAVRFREFLGTFVEHCHNTQHEDHAMLLRFDVERPGQVRVMPTPVPSWEGVGYVQSYALPTFRTGDPEYLEQDLNDVLIDDVLRNNQDSDPGVDPGVDPDMDPGVDHGMDPELDPVVDPVDSRAKAKKKKRKRAKKKRKRNRKNRRHRNKWRN